MAFIDYLHYNPVRRGLCKDTKQWFWSSIRYYITEPTKIDPDSPKIQGLPPDFFTRNNP